MSVAFAAIITTNAFLMQNAPNWVSEPRLVKVQNRIEQKLEWSTRRVTVTFYTSPAEFQNKLGLSDGSILAFTKKSDQSIHIGPSVNSKNFDEVLGHELTHVILSQKYKSHIPAWLEEGLANWAAGVNALDKVWLRSQKLPTVLALAHPLKSQSTQDMRLKYMSSLALVKFLERKCPSMRELLNLSLKGKLEDHIPTFCQIKNLQSDFETFVSKRL
jgi:hypothetical protein